MVEIDQYLKEGRAVRLGSFRGESLNIGGTRSVVMSRGNQKFYLYIYNNTQPTHTHAREMLDIPNFFFSKSWFSNDVSQSHKIVAYFPK
jgi:hypothetical protein